MGIESVTETLGDMTKSKTGIVLIVGVVGVALFAMIRNQNDKDEAQMTMPTGYTSYPSAEKNADVIIDSVNQNSNYNTNSLLGVLDALQKWQSERFDETDTTIKDGNTAIGEKLDEHQQELKDRLDNGFAGVNDQFDNMKDQINNVGNQVVNVGNKVDTVSGQVGGVSNQVGGLQGQINNQNNVINNLQNLINQILSLVTPKPTTSTSSKSSSSSRDRDSSSSSSSSKGKAPNVNDKTYVNSGPGTRLGPGYGK